MAGEAVAPHDVILTVEALAWDELQRRVRTLGGVSLAL
jgi:hypothetical protein